MHSVGEPIEHCSGSPTISFVAAPRRTLSAGLLAGLLVVLVGGAPAAATRPPKPRPCQPPQPLTLPITTTTTTVPCLAASLSKKQAAGKWEGSLDVESQGTAGGNTVTAIWSGPIMVTVRDDGTVVGSASATTPGPRGAFVGRGATAATLGVSGAFTGNGFDLRFNATSVNGYEAGFHLLYLPGPPTIHVPLLKLKRLKKPFADGIFGLFNAGSEELRGGGGSALADGLITLKQQ